MSESDTPFTGRVFKLTMVAGAAIFEVGDSIIRQKKQRDREAGRSTLAAYASDSTPGTIGRFLFGIISLSIVVLVSPLVLLVVPGIPEAVVLIGLPLWIAYLGSAVHGGIWAYRQSS